jgi:hypothetical protein
LTRIAPLKNPSIYLSNPYPALSPEKPFKTIPLEGIGFPANIQKESCSKRLQ